MRNTRFRWVVFYALAATLGCRAPAKEWNGRWKLNPSKSSFQGPVITISISANGEYRYDDGSSNFTFRCDGKDRPVGRSRILQACLKSSATTLDLTRKEDGVKTHAYRWELSADRNVLTAVATALRPSGPAVTGQVVASRISGSNDFSGQWRDTSYLQRHADLTLRLEGQILHISYPDADQYIDAPLDGNDAAIHGPHAPEGMTYMARLAGPREIHSLTKRDGKAVIQGSMELSQDGRVITESWWKPGQPAGKGVFIYEKE